MAALSVCHRGQRKEGTIDSMQPATSVDTHGLRRDGITAARQEKRYQSQMPPGGSQGGQAHRQFRRRRCNRTQRQ